MSAGTPNRDQRVERHLMRVRGAGKTARNLTGDLFSFSICRSSDESNATLPPVKKRKLQHKEAVSATSTTASVPHHVTSTVPTASSSVSMEKAAAKARARARAARLFEAHDEADHTKRTKRTAAGLGLSEPNAINIPEASHSHTSQLDHGRQGPAIAASGKQAASTQTRNSEARTAPAKQLSADVRSGLAPSPTASSSRPGDSSVIVVPIDPARKEPRTREIPQGSPVAAGFSIPPTRPALANIASNRAHTKSTTTKEKLSTVSRSQTESATRTSKHTTKVLLKEPAEDRTAATEVSRARKTSNESYKINLMPLPTPKPRKRRLPG